MRLIGFGPSRLGLRRRHLRPLSRDGCFGLSVYMTGEGLTTPAGVTGAISPADGSGLKNLVAAVSATVGGVPADVDYAGSAPGMVAGIAQVNVRIPANAQSGSSIPIVISMEASSTQSGVTLAIQ